MSERTPKESAISLFPNITSRVSAQPKFMRNALAFMGHYVRTRPYHFVGLFVLVLGAAACGIGVQYGMKLMIDAMSAAGRQGGRTGVEIALAVFIGLIFMEAVLWRFSGWVGSRTTIRVGEDIRVDLFGHLAGHSMRFFHENLSGSLGHRLTATSNAFSTIISRLVWNIAPPFVSFLGALVLFSGLDMAMTLTLAGFVSLITGVLIFFGLRGQPFHQAYAQQSGTAGGELMDVINNIWAVKTFSAREREKTRLAKAFSREARAHLKSWMYNEKIRVVNDIGLVVMAGVTLLWAAHLWSVGKITPGDVVLVSTLTFRLLHGSRDFALSLIEMGQEYSFIGETLKLVGQPHAVLDPQAPRPALPKGGSISLENVTFGYNPERPVLRDLDLHITAGQRVGFAGTSGAGKSTLVHLVQRMHEVQAGRILVDGEPVSNLRQDALRAKMAVVPQDVNLFHRSVLENIRFGRPDASDEEVFEAARAAFCEDFINNLEEGWDTIVGDRGAKLSGGQRQRIGIARAFLKDAPILILDEATSALDVESEAAIQKALKRLMHGRTVLAIAHRLSTLADMDRIVVLEHGEIVEDGSLDELRRGVGPFSRLWRMQTGGEVVTPLRRPVPLKAAG
ncbi:MAG: ABC transporter ATP-binding protein [Caulobacteraceae bacterium]